jgi:hypothetical protein
MICKSDRLDCKIPSTDNRAVKYNRYIVKNPSSWTASNVVEWMSAIQCSNAREVFLFKGIEGNDLLQLTDPDLRFDLKFRRIHDRKYILREIQNLRNLKTTL